jgi:hypothetical protein
MTHSPHAVAVLEQEFRENEVRAKEARGHEEKHRHDAEFFEARARDVRHALAFMKASL